MRRIRATPILVVALLFQVSEPVRAQFTPRPRRTIGLALSGGNAKGFAHVGVLRVLEQAGVRVDVVSGTSMGAILGALYASGYTADGLQAFVLEEDWERLLSDADENWKPTVRGARPQPSLVVLPVRGGLPRLPTGLAEGQRFSELLARVTWPVQSVRDFRRLPLPFAAVATDLESGEAVRLERGFLPDVLRASAAIPSVVSPVSLDGRLLGDGALARNIPAEDARALGANVVICSDVSDTLEPADSLQSFVALLNQAISFRMSEMNEEQRQLCDVLIRPNIDGLPSTSVDRALEWIERGETAARQVLPELRRLASRSQRQNAIPDRPPSDSVYVEALQVEGLTKSRQKVARELLDLPVPAWITPATVQHAVRRLYDTGLYALVRYRLDDRSPAGTVLVMVLEDRSRDALGFGFRYESRYKGSVFFGATVYNVFLRGSVARLDLQFGEQARLAGEYVHRFGPRHGLTAGVGAGYVRTPFDFYRRGDRIAERRIDVFDVSAFAGLDIGRSAVVGVEVKGEHIRGDATGVTPASTTPRSLHTVSAVARVNTYTRSFFHKRGYSASVTSEWAGHVIGSNASFTQYMFRANGHVPLSPATTLFGGAMVGVTSGTDLPAHKLYRLGGSNEYYMFPDRHIPFLGLEPQERFGPYVQVVTAGVQYEAIEDVYVGFQWNGGTTLSRWSVDLDRWVKGYGIIIGAETVVGPVRLTLAGQNLNRWPDVEIDVGYRF